MSSFQNKASLIHDDPDLFLEFLGAYHEGKWEQYRWYDLDVELIPNPSGCGCKVGIDCDDSFSREDVVKFSKYLSYQCCQFVCGKTEIVLAYKLYVKIYGKKTREVSVNTDVSLDQNKKYYGPKVL